MKIAFVNQSLASGGAERATVNLANGLVDQNGIEVVLITAAKAENEYECDCRVGRICALKNRLIPDVRSLRKTLIENQIDIAVGMGLYANFCVCLANWRIPTKMVISERNAPAQDHISKKSKLLRFFIYRNADAYVFQTSGARAFYSDSIQRRSVVIPNPVKEGLPQRTAVHEKKIIAVGRLAQQKNYPMLLKAFAEVCKVNREYQLHIFGQGHSEQLLLRLCEKLGIQDRVVFEGFCENVHERIKNADIYILSSDFEGLPNALMEAMAMGFPVVSTDCPPGGPSMLIQHGENGLLCPVGDSQKLAAEILWLIQHPVEKETMGQKAKEIYDMCSMERILQKWINFFTKID